MIHFKDIDYIEFNKFHEKITDNLPKGYEFGYFGNIWGKWASDDRHFYIKDAEGKRIGSDRDINNVDKLWASLKYHITKQSNVGHLNGEL